MSSIDFAFPAGDESEVSSDEWDLGFADKKPQMKKEVGIAPVEDEQVSVLKWAISKGHVETVEQLLQKGLQVDTRLDFERTPLMCAVSVANCDLTKILLDHGASANFSKDHWTVLMACCTASAPEDKICSCLELVLSRNADPNMVDRSHMTCLMFASRDGFSKIINMLVSYGANVNIQDLNGFTALCYAAQYGREECVLKLVHLGADKHLKTKRGKTAADLATQFKHSQIVNILASNSSQNSSTHPMMPQESRDSMNKLDELELLFHGLGLSYLTDIIIDNDISCSKLLTMDKNDLHKIGITEPLDQHKVLMAVHQMELDKVHLDRVSELAADNEGIEELHTFLLSLRQQCLYLTESIQDVVSRFPHKASQLVFSLDPHGKAQSVCNQLLLQTKDLQQEVTLLQSLVCQVEQAEESCDVPTITPKLSWRRVLKGAVLGVLGAGILLLLAKGASATGGN